MTKSEGWRGIAIPLQITKLEGWRGVAVPAQLAKSEGWRGIAVPAQLAKLAEWRGIGGALGGLQPDLGAQAGVVYVRYCLLSEYLLLLEGRILLLI